MYCVGYVSIVTGGGPQCLPPCRLGRRCMGSLAIQVLNRSPNTRPAALTCCYPQIKVFGCLQWLASSSPTGAWASTIGVPSHTLNKCMGIHHTHSDLRAPDLCAPTAYTTVVTHLALGSLLCRLMLVKVVISRSAVAIVMVRVFVYILEMDEYTDPNTRTR